MGITRILRNLLTALVLLTLLSPSPSAYAAEPIKLDGTFSDWAGEATISDTTGDSSAKGDIAAFYWATNDNEEFVYWQVQRVTGATGSVIYSVYLDMNNNGNYAERADRRVDINYRPSKRASEVEVGIYDGSDTEISIIEEMDWGQSNTEGPLNVEARASFADLGMTTGQALRMYVKSSQAKPDRAPDAGDIQWSPVPAMGYGFLGVFLVLGVYMAWRRRESISWRRS